MKYYYSKIIETVNRVVFYEVEAENEEEARELLEDGETTKELMEDDKLHEEIVNRNVVEPLMKMSMPESLYLACKKYNEAEAAQK